jgi:hypothetical protein
MYRGHRASRVILGRSAGRPRHAEKLTQARGEYAGGERELDRLANAG